MSKLKECSANVQTSDINFIGRIKRPINFKPCNNMWNIQGQLYDLLQLFRLGGNIQNKNYVFLGDYVDKGINSVQTFSYLICLKIKYPSRITLLRGHHQSKNIAFHNGLYQQIIRKYGNHNPFKYFTEVFEYLPQQPSQIQIYSVYMEAYPQRMSTVDSIRTIDRKVEETQEEDVITDFIQNIQDWGLNPRGGGWLYGSQTVKEFCYINGFELVARSHQISMLGYCQWFEEKNLVTIQSAPNFVLRCGNTAAVMQVCQDSTHNFKIFRSVPQSQASIYKHRKFPNFI